MKFYKIGGIISVQDTTAVAFPTKSCNTLT